MCSESPVPGYRPRQNHTERTLRSAGGLGAVLMASTLLCFPAPADETNIANERPPMTARELEQHWNLDCLRERERIITLLAEAERETEPKESTAIFESSVETLELCAAARRAVAGTVGGRCPDYASAAAALRSLVPERRDRRAAILHETRRHLECAD